MVKGKGIVEGSGVSVVIPKLVADTLGISDGDSVDVDFFNGTEELSEEYGADISFIAITL